MSSIDSGEQLQLSITGQHGPLDKQVILSHLSHMNSVIDMEAQAIDVEAQVNFDEFQISELQAEVSALKQQCRDLKEQLKAKELLISQQNSQFIQQTQMTVPEMHSQETQTQIPIQNTKKEPKKCQHCNNQGNYYMEKTQGNLDLSWVGIMEQDLSNDGFFDRLNKRPSPYNVKPYSEKFKLKENPYHLSDNSQQTSHLVINQASQSVEKIEQGRLTPRGKLKKVLKQSFTNRDIDGKIRYKQVESKFKLGKK